MSAEFSIPYWNLRAKNNTIATAVMSHPPVKLLPLIAAGIRRAMLQKDLPKALSPGWEVWILTGKHGNAVNDYVAVRP
jgi:hypothetical protein